jgi:hypothetical protein
LIRDLSLTGIGLVSAWPLEPGTVIAVQLENWAGGLAVIKTAEVRHATPLPGEGWLLGCFFRTRLHADEVASLLAGEVTRVGADGDFHLTDEVVTDLLLGPDRLQAR